jgi:hypothetical protein
MGVGIKMTPYKYTAKECERRLKYRISSRWRLGHLKFYSLTNLIDESMSCVFEEQELFRLSPSLIHTLINEVPESKGRTNSTTSKNILIH